MLLASAAIAGCGAKTNDAPSGGPDQGAPTGQIGAELVLGTVIVNRVDWTLTNTGTSYMNTGFFDVTGPGNTFTGLITGVPAAMGYDLTFTANSTDMTRVCSGHAMPTPFAVNGGQTVLQAVHLNCQDTRAKTGKILVNGNVNACPTADNVSAMPLSAPVGSSIALTGTATDPDNAPSPLAYSFALSAMQPSGPGAGTLTNANTATPSFQCTAPGNVALTMSVNDGDTQCTPDTLQVLVVCTGVDACAGLPPCPTTACHQAGVCDHTTGMCSTGPALAAGTSCSDGNPCNGAETCNAAGSCVAGTALVCMASDACHLAGTCDPASGCSNPAAPNGTACPSGMCQGGVCQNACMGVTCPATACQTAGTCNPATGMCSAAMSVANGTTCNDGVATNYYDECTNGSCAGFAYNCDPNSTSTTATNGSCCSCESTSHVSGTSTNHNCDNTGNLCDHLVGMTTAAAATADAPAIPGGVSYAAQCRAILDCYHRTGCAGDGTTYSDCFCGSGADANACFNGTFTAAGGACKTEIMIGANSQSPTQISLNFDNAAFPIGIANQMSSTCDSFFCTTQCLGGGK